MGMFFCRSKHQTIPMSLSRATSRMLLFRFELAQYILMTLGFFEQVHHSLLLPLY